jgi:hypothetical protein
MIVLGAAKASWRGRRFRHHKQLTRSAHRQSGFYAWTFRNHLSTLRTDTRPHGEGGWAGTHRLRKDGRLLIVVESLVNQMYEIPLHGIDDLSRFE